MYEYLWPLLKISCFNIAYNAILDYFGKPTNKAKAIRQGFNGWVYYIFAIITISYLVEYTTIFYSYKMLTESLLSSSKAGITSVQIYGWRCSGAYYAETKCDLESQNRIWDKHDVFFVKPVNFTNGLIYGRMFKFGIMSFGQSSKLSSGYYIACNAEHAKYIKNIMKREKWDGPQPIHNPDDSCECDKSTGTKMSKYPSISSSRLSNPLFELSVSLKLSNYTTISSTVSN
jgi:hypothetical protein